MSPRKVLQQAAVDSEFRAVLRNDPEKFGVGPDALPEAVEEADQESLDFWTDTVAAAEIYACQTSCSAGWFTLVCDGTTK